MITKADRQKQLYTDLYAAESRLELMRILNAEKPSMKIKRQIQMAKTPLPRLKCMNYLDKG